MATIALAAASGFEVGTAGYAFAAMMGSIIDQAYTFPALFPADPIEGMRVGEVQVMGADEGMPVAKCYGAQAKVGGQIIWAGKLEERQTSNHSGKNTNRIEYTYYADCAIAICRTAGTALDKVERIWADEKLVYHNPDIFTPVVATGDGTGMMVNAWTTGWLFFDPVVNSTVIADVYDKYSVGSKLTLAGFTNSENNFSNVEIIEKRKERFFAHPYSDYRDLFAFRLSRVGVDEWTLGTYPNYGPHGTTNVITFTETVGNGWKNNMQRAGVPDLNLGDQTTPWAHMAAISGIGNVPAFKDLAYMGCDLALEDYGVRIPTFAFLVTNNSQNTVGDVLDDILADTGLPSSVFDTTGVSTQTVLGYTIKGPTETVKKLQPLFVAFDIVAQERGTTLLFTDRSAVDTVTIDADYLGAVSGDTNETSGGVEMQEVPVNERLGEVTVSYINADDEWQAGLARARAWTQPNSTPGLNARETPDRWTSKSINLSNMTLAEASADEIANRLLWTSWADSIRFKFTLP